MRLIARDILILLVLLVPTLFLLGTAAHYQYTVQQQPAYILPITGYDPRDPVYGHYFQFQIDVTSAEYKALSEKVADLPAITLTPQPYRFYIDEQDGPWLDAYFRKHAGDFAIMVKIHDRKLHIQNLLIDGRPYRETLREKPAIAP